MHAVVGHVTYRALGDATGQHSETVRRYMQGQAPSVEFLASLCSTYDVNAQWLLTGQGPIKQSHAKAHALRDANPGELLSAVAHALERLTLRVDRLELFVQMLESRLRQTSAPRTAAAAAETDHAQASPTTTDPAAAPAAGPTIRARRIADALTQRPRADAD